MIIFFLIFFKSSNLVIALDEHIEGYLINPSVLRMFRIIKAFRVVRIFRFLKSAKGIRKLFNVLLISLPAIFNVGSLLFLIMYIYSILGMNLFLNVKLTNALTPTMSFQTFFKSFILLFRIGIVYGWHDLLAALMLSKDDPGSTCLDNYSIQDLPSEIDPKTVNGKLYFWFNSNK